MPTSFLITFLAALLGKGFILVVRYLVEAIMDYCHFRNAESADTSEDEP